VRPARGLSFEEQLEFPEFPAQTLAELGRLLPSFSNPQNPLDVTGYVVMDPMITLQSLEIVAREVADNYDMVLYSATIPRSEAPNPARSRNGWTHWPRRAKT